MEPVTLLASVAIVASILLLILIVLTPEGGGMPKGGIWTLMDIISGPRWPDQPVQSPAPQPKPHAASQPHRGAQPVPQHVIQRPQAQKPQAAGKTTVHVKEDDRGVHPVSCTINGKSFSAIADTGASTCLISLDVARAAGINVRSLPRTQATQADGSTISQRATVVDWVIDGKLKATAVRTCIIEKNGVEALLGKSALQQFALSNPDGHTLFISER